MQHCAKHDTKYNAKDGCYLCDRPKVSHYQGDGIEPIDYINSHNFNFNLGNAIKYISRCGKKECESTENDLKKAIEYLNLELKRIKNVEA